MNDRLFAQLINLLLAHAETQREEARAAGREADADHWSVAAGNLDYIRQRYRR